MHSVHACPMWARFLAKCCKMQLNQVVFCCILHCLHCTKFSLFSCNVLFVGISQMNGCGERLLNVLDCVGWDVKLQLQLWECILLRYIPTETLMTFATDVNTKLKLCFKHRMHRCASSYNVHCYCLDDFSLDIL